MQVIRNTYESRRIAYDDDAYNLPIDTVYFIESKWNYRLNDYVFSHKDKIEELLRKDIGGFFPYKFEIIALSNLQNPLLQESFRDLHPEMEQNIDFATLADLPITDKEQEYQSAMMQRLISKQTVFEPTFIARTIPQGDVDCYGFFAVDVSLCTETLVLELLEEYIQKLNDTNLGILSGQVTECDDIIRDEILHLDSSPSFLTRDISFCGNEEMMDYCMYDASELEINEIDKLHITPELRELAFRIKNEIDSYQRTNGVNILLEDICKDFLKSFEKLDVKPLSILEIDKRYNIYLSDYKKEVKMHTLPKTIYFFFLRHPQGIYLKDISDYRTELVQIYQKITRQSLTIEEMREKIDGVLDLTNGNLNQYICRISEAFRNVLSSDLAKNYTIAGKRNELRRITLDISKIIIPDNLKF